MKTEKERERSKTTYQTPVMQIRIYTGDLRSIISGGLQGHALPVTAPVPETPRQIRAQFRIIHKALIL